MPKKLNKIPKKYQKLNKIPVWGRNLIAKKSKIWSNAEKIKQNSKKIPKIKPNSSVGPKFDRKKIKNLVKCRKKLRKNALFQKMTQKRRKKTFFCKKIIKKIKKMGHFAKSAGGAPIFAQRTVPKTPTKTKRISKCVF